MLAAAMSFNSGILLFADAEHVVPGKMRPSSRKIFPRQYAANPDNHQCARSVFVVSELADGGLDRFERCETALDSVRPADCTIDRMRETIEMSLAEPQPGLPASGRDPSSFVVIYSPCDERYSLFRTTNGALREVAGYDCVGTAAYLGHYLMRDRYSAARSMDELNLAMVFSIAIETLEGIRACEDGCGKSSEMAVMYADGHLSDIQRIPHDTRKERNVALTGLART